MSEQKRVERNCGYGDSTRFLISMGGLYTLESVSGNDTSLPRMPNGRLAGGLFWLGGGRVRLARRPRPLRPTSPRRVLQQIVADGCTLTRDVPEILATLPFSSVEIDNFYVEKTPSTHGNMYRGTATK